MLKIISAFAFVNVFALFTVLQDKPLKIHQLVPLTLAEGETQEVRVVIDKGSIGGFAKFEVKVEDGLAIEAGDIGSASFTFEEQIAKFIWFALPEEEQFTISYFLSNSDNTVGEEKKVDASFSYLKDNTKKVYKLPSHQITIESYKNDSLVSIDEISVPENESEEAAVTLSPEEKLEAIRNYSVKINREFERIENGLYRMNISIDKGPIEGFAKLEDVVPEGFEYIEESTSGAIFTRVGSKAKFVWFNLPESESIDISYNLRAEETNVAGLHNITGVFTYLVDDKDILSQSVPAFFQISAQELEEAFANNKVGINDMDELIEEPETWNQSELNPDANGEVNPFNKPSEEEELEETDLVEEVSTEGENTIENDAIKSSEAVGISGMENTVVPENITAKSEGSSEESWEFSDADDGIRYRVQICASRKVAERNYFKKYNNFHQQVVIENHDGWVKYTTGSHNQYKSARDSREQINTQFTFDGPFVTAYNDGVRISVQEALMISNQKWYQ